MIIIASFVIITSLILWFVIGSRGMWGFKVATIAVALYFCLSISFSIEDFEGWPSSVSLPEKFRVQTKMFAGGILFYNFITQRTILG